MLITVSRGPETERELSACIVHEEQSWLMPPRPQMEKTTARVLVSRWRGSRSQPYEVNSSIDEAYHVISIALRSTNLSIFSSSKLVHEGRMTPGTVRINKPSESLRAIFYGDYDILHLYIPNTLFADCVEADYRWSATECIEFSETPMPSDPVIDRLARAFIQAEHGGAFGYKYIESVALAIVARTLGTCSKLSSNTNAPGASSLVKWRLKRVVDYIEAHLSEPIGLREMAASAGLSRMHFAAQFRAATGMRPHEYLLRRRTERAQILLSASMSPLVEVALDVGFKTQSHFTTVFTRLVGKTPKNWRQQTLAARSDYGDRTSRCPVPLFESACTPFPIRNQPQNVPISYQNGAWRMSGTQASSLTHVA
jgi:AraC family transcriptional regulator